MGFCFPPVANRCANKTGAASAALQPHRNAYEERMSAIGAFQMYHSGWRGPMQDRKKLCNFSVTTTIVPLMDHLRLVMLVYRYAGCCWVMQCKVPRPSTNSRQG